MAHSSGSITAPVNTDDIVATIAESLHDIGTLGMSAKTNGWSKIKPVIHTKKGNLTDADRKSVQYGITNIPFFTNTAFMALFMHSGKPDPMSGAKSSYWTYARPGANDWKREEDYAGYWHNAIEPISPIAADKITVIHDRGDPDYGYVHFDFPVATDARNLKISDFDLIQLSSPANAGAPFYLGVCITDGVCKYANSSNMNDYTGTRMITQAAKINDNLQTVTVGGKACARISIPHDDFMAADKVPPNGKVMIFAFLSSAMISKFSIPVSGATYIPLNMSGKEMILITGDRLYITFTELTAQKLSSPSTGTYNGQLTYKVTIKNQTNMSFGVNGGTVAASGPGSPPSSGFIGSIRTIAAGETITIQGVIPITRAGTYTVTVTYTDVDGNSRVYTVSKSVTAPS